MPFLVLIILGFVVGVPVCLAVLFARVTKLRSESERLQAELARVEALLRSFQEPTLREEPLAEELLPSKRLLEARQETRGVPPTAFAPIAPVSKPIPVFQPPPIISEPPARPAAVADAGEGRSNWEQFLGVKLFAWLGGLALFIGVAFFLKYSFDRDLVPEWLRVLMGFVLGGALIGGGQYFRKRDYLVTAQTLAASGLVILYAVSFVARTHYQLINTPTLFALMCAVTVAGFALAIFMDAQVVAILGVLGGFLTPLLVGGSNPNPVVLFGYFGFLNAGLAAIGRRKQWPVLLKLGAAATILSELAWCATRLKPDNALATQLMFMMNNAVYIAAFYLDSEPSKERIAAPAAVSAAAFFTGAGVIIAARSSIQPGLALAAVFAGFGALAALFVRTRAIPLLAGAILGSAAVIVVWAEGAADEQYFFNTTWMLISSVLLGGAGLALAHLIEPGERRRLLAGLGAVVAFLLLAYLGARLPTDSPHLLHACILALSLLSIWGALSLREHVLMSIALAGAVIAQHAWLAVHLGPQHAASAGLWRLGLFFVFTGAPFVIRSRLSAGDLIPWRVSSSAGPGHFFLIYHSARVLWPEFEYPGLYPAVLAIPSIAALLAMRAQTAGEERMRFTGIYAASVLFFLTLIFPVQFRHQWLTIGWALEGAALLWLYRRAPLPWLPALGSLLLLAAFARLALNPEVLGYQARSGRPILNWYLYSYGIVAAAQFLGARWVKPGALRELNGRALFSSCGVILLFLLMNIEIADFFADGQFLTFDFSQNFGRDMTYSLAWGLFALALLVAGVVRDLKPVRIAGLALMAVTLLKLFFHDLSRLDQLYRIGAFIGMAVMLIFASWLYQKFMGRSGPAKAPPQG